MTVSAWQDRLWERLQQPPKWIGVCLVCTLLVFGAIKHFFKYVEFSHVGGSPCFVVMSKNLHAISGTSWIVAVFITGVVFLASGAEITKRLSSFIRSTFSKTFQIMIKSWHKHSEHSRQFTVIFGVPLLFLFLKWIFSEVNFPTPSDFFICGLEIASHVTSVKLDWIPLGMVVIIIFLCLSVQRQCTVSQIGIAKNDLNYIEQRVLNVIRDEGPVTERDIQKKLKEYTRKEIRDSLANLIKNDYIRRSTIWLKGTYTFSKEPAIENSIQEDIVNLLRNEGPLSKKQIQKKLEQYTDKNIEQTLEDLILGGKVEIHVRWFKKLYAAAQKGSSQENSIREDILNLLRKEGRLSKRQIHGHLQHEKHEIKSAIKTLTNLGCVKEEGIWMNKVYVFCFDPEHDKLNAQTPTWAIFVGVPLASIMIDDALEIIPPLTSFDFTRDYVKSINWNFSISYTEMLLSVVVVCLVFKKIRQNTKLFLKNNPLTDLDKRILDFIRQHQRTRYEIIYHIQQTAMPKNPPSIKNINVKDIDESLLKLLRYEHIKIRRSKMPPFRSYYVKN